MELKWTVNKCGTIITMQAGVELTILVSLYHFPALYNLQVIFFPSTIPLWNNLALGARLLSSLYYFNRHIAALFL